MPWVSLGKVTTTAGVPVRITANNSTPGARVQCHAIMIQALPSNTGRVVLGDSSAVSASTYAHALAILAVPTANVIPGANGTNASAVNGFNAADYYIDVTVNGEGCIVSYLDT